MCASGLFSPNEPPSSHAEQLVQFGLDCIHSIEEVNNQMSIDLSVRCGINSGGPIMAGVMGNDKPTFDIISDTINIAARLQSTCAPNKIQISEDTKKFD